MKPVRAQQTAVQLANAELRTFFSTVSNPTPAIEYLYDMSAHMVDSAFFDKIVYDTSWTENWYALYEELYYAAYDTTPLQRADQVFAAAWARVQHDTIPLGIIKRQYNLLKPDALTTNLYFDFDTINHVITDLPGASSPYTIHTVFAGAPLAKESYFSTVTFEVSPDFMFGMAVPPAVDFEINFDDGTGVGSPGTELEFAL